MRAKHDPALSSYLLRVGNGTEPQDSDGRIKIPPSMIIPFAKNVEPLQQLILTLFSQILKNIQLIHFQ